MTFDVGDIVQLKSGGPLLTVANVAKDAIHCVYYCEASGEFRSHDFAPALLVHVEIEDAEEDLDDDEED